jgi:hypothetical protein
VNVGKTEVMKCKARSGSGKGNLVLFHAAFVAEMLKKIQLNVSYVRNGCTRLKPNQNFKCLVCTGRVANRSVEDKVLLLDNAGQLECVDRFCYLVDVIGMEEELKKRQELE